jgi:hypothetical protein
VPELDVPEPGVAGLGALGPAPGRPLMPEPLVPEPLLPVPGVVGSVTLGLVPGRSLMPEPLLPVPGVVGSVTLGLVPGRSLMPEPLVPEPLLPVPGVAGLGVLGPVPGRPLMPEPLVPEPLLPVPEVCANTNGAVTTSTARAATIVLLNRLNISVFSSNLEGCACVVFLFEPCSLRSTERGNRPARQRSNSYAMGTRRTARPQRYHHRASHSLVLRVDASGPRARVWHPSLYPNERTQCEHFSVTSHSQSRNSRSADISLLPVVGSCRVCIGGLHYVIIEI